MIETALGTIDIGNLIAIIGYIIGLIVGYVKLNEKVKQNEIDIEQINSNCKACKQKNVVNMQKIDARIDSKFDKLVAKIEQIQKQVGRISTQISKLSGIIETFLAQYNRNNK